MVVIGSDGLGLLGEVAFRGVARGLVGHVSVPVVEVPRGAERPRSGAMDPPAPVVVGDDGTPGSAEAVCFAAHRATRRGAPLVVVRVGPDARLLSEEAPALGADRPSSTRVVLGEESADRVLAEQCHDAELVVLGVAAPGWRHLRDRARRGVARRTTCPVAVVPPVPRTQTALTASADRATAR